MSRFVNQNLIGALMSGQAGPNVLQKIEQRALEEEARARQTQDFDTLMKQRAANLRGTKLDNTAKARNLASAGQPDEYRQLQIENLREQVEQRRRQANAPKPLTELQQKMEYVSGVGFNEMTPEQRKEAFGMITSGQSPMQQVELDLKKAQLAEKQSKVAEVETQRSKAADLKDEVIRLSTELLNDENLERNVGALDGSGVGQFFTLRGESADFQNKFNKLKSILTAENLDMMTGVLSETDLKILSDIAGGGLNLKSSEEAFKDELRRMGGIDQAPREITSQAQFDSLPSGAIYLEDGVQYRKP